MFDREKIINDIGIGMYNNPDLLIKLLRSLDDAKLKFFKKEIEKAKQRWKDLIEENKEKRALEINSAINKNWFSKLSKKEQLKYLKQHPKSSLNKKYKSVLDPKIKEGLKSKYRPSLYGIAGDTLGTIGGSIIGSNIAGDSDLEKLSGSLIGLYLGHKLGKNAGKLIGHLKNKKALDKLHGKDTGYLNYLLGRHLYNKAPHQYSMK